MLGYLIARERKSTSEKEAQHFKEALIAAHPERTSDILRFFDDVAVNATLAPPNPELLAGADLTNEEESFILDLVRQGVAVIED